MKQQSFAWALSVGILGQACAKSAWAQDPYAMPTTPPVATAPAGPGQPYLPPPTSSPSSASPPPQAVQPEPWRPPPTAQEQPWRPPPTAQAQPWQPQQASQARASETLMIAGMVPSENELSGDRTLKGFTFHYPLLVDNAFTAYNFHVGSSVEVYHQSDVTGSVPVPGSSTLESFTFDRDLTFVKVNFGLDLRPAQIFTFGVEADYLAEAGFNGETLFTYGAAGGFDLRPNLKFRLVRSDKYGSQLALRAHATIQGGIRAMPQGLLIDINNSLNGLVSDPARPICLVQGDFACAFPDLDNVADDIVATRKRYGGGGALAFAQAINRYLAGQLALGVEGASTSVALPRGSGQKTKLDASETVFYAGISPALNFYPKLPIGLSYEYRFELNKSSYDANEDAGIPEPVSVSANSHRMNWGLCYTGRRDLMLGWLAGISFLRDVIRSQQHAATDPSAFVFSAQFDMRYFF